MNVNKSREPILRGLIDKFTILQVRQSTLNSKWKLEERKYGEKFVNICTQKVSHLI